MAIRHYMGSAIPATADAAGILGALYTLLSAATDFNGNPTAGDVTWTLDAATPGTRVLYSSAFGARNARIIYAIMDVGAPTPNMYIDTFTQANLLVGTVIDAAGAYTAWTDVSPFTGGTFEGYTRLSACAGMTIIHAIGGTHDCSVQCGTAAVLQACHAGAIVKASGTAAESDGYRYGCATSGVGDLISTWRSSTGVIGAPGMFGQHGVTNGYAHMYAYIVGSTGTQVCGISMIYLVAATATDKKITAAQASPEAIFLRAYVGTTYTVGTWAGVYDCGQAVSMTAINDVGPVLWGMVIGSSLLVSEQAVAFKMSF